MKVKMRKTFILVLLTLAALLGAYLFFFSVDRQFTREHRIGPQLALAETVHVDRRAYTSSWFGGDTLYLPLPASASRVVKQRLIYRGRIVWEAASDRRSNRTVTCRVSPSGRVVLLESLLHSAPWVIVDLQTGNTCTVADPGEEIPDHAYIYPFDFLRWEEDSGRVLAQVSGSSVKGPYRQIKIREIWALDLRNCGRVMLKHCEKAWSLDVDWGDTDCR